MSLLPISYPLIPRYAAPPKYADMMGIATFLNDLFTTQPQRFGTQDQQDELKAWAKKRAITPGDLMEKAFYEELVAKLQGMGLGENFRDLRVAYLGGFPEGSKESNTDAAHPLRELLSFHEIGEKDEEGRLTLLTSPAIIKKIGGKVDYLITGNVLNDPTVDRSDETMMACGNMMKQRGRIIHILNYGEDRYTKNIQNEDVQFYAGQAHAYNIPDEPYMEFGTDTMVLQQRHEVDHTPESYYAFHRLQDARANEADPNHTFEYIEETAPQTNGWMAFVSEPEKMSNEMAEAQFDTLLTKAHEAENDAERDLVRAFQGMCRKHRIDTVPELRFYPTPATGAHAVLHRNTILVDTGMMGVLTEPRHQLAVTAHELGHILKQDGSYTKETEYACDRLGTLLIGNNRDLAEAYDIIHANSAKVLKDLYSGLDEKMVANLEEFRLASVAKEEIAYGTREERRNALSAVDVTDRTELTATIRSFNASQQER